MITVNRVRRSSALVIGLTVLSFPAALRAQAFGLNEIGSCALSRGFAVTASPCKDASSIYWNPAATTQLQGWSFLGGVAVIPIKARFVRDTTHKEYESEIPTAIVPHLFATFRPANSKLSYGLGVYVPYGLTSQWSEDFPGRFVAKKASLQTIYVQPNIAYQLTSNWSIGGGPVIGHSKVELQQGIDLSEQVASVVGVDSIRFFRLGIPRHTEFARATLEGSSMAYGAHVGVSGKISDRWMFGARFLTSLWFDYDDADATFTAVPTGLVVAAAGQPLGVPAGTPVDNLVAPQFLAGGRLINQTGSTTLAHPAQIQAGFGYTGRKDWLFEADVTWIGWKQFREIVIDFSNATTPDRTLIEDYNHSLSVRLGAEHSMTNGWKLRGGLAAAASAAPQETVTPLLPEQDRTYAMIGVGRDINAKWSWDAGYARVFTPGSRGRLDDRPTRTLTATQVNNGAFYLSANVFTVSLKASY
jgi:long-chain fatty acid transport protein